MTNVFEILKKHDIDHKIDLESFMNEHFFFIPYLDPEILDQMTSEAICEHWEFYNNNSYAPVKFLLENNKVSVDGFNVIMRNEYHFSGSMLDTKDRVYQLIEEFIVKNNIDITQYFYGDHIELQMVELLHYKENFDNNLYYKNLDLKKALEQSNSIAGLIFSFREDDTDARREMILQYIVDNFEMLSEVFFKQTRAHKCSPDCYYENTFFNLLSNPLPIIARYIDKHYGLLEDPKFFNELLIDVLTRDLLKNKEFSYLRDIVEKVQDTLPKIYENITTNRHYVNFFNTTKALDVDNITVEKFQNYIEVCTDVERWDVTSNMEIHKKLNEEEFNYDYSNGKFFVDYTPEFLMFYVDKSIELLNLKQELAEKGEKEPITSHWKWSSFETTMIRDLTHFAKRNTNDWNAVIEKALTCKVYQDRLIDFVIDNGSVVILNCISKYQPKLVKKIFKDKNALMKIIVNEYNNEVFGKWD